MLELRDVVVRFGGLAAVNAVSFAVAPGTIVALIGPNGAGKTTLINAISGFQRLTAGSVRLDGREIGGLAPDRIAARGLTRTFQHTRLFGNTTVRDSLLIAQHLASRHSVVGALVGSAAMRTADAKGRERAADLLDRVRLSARADDRAGDLAYGEQRLLAVAVALSARPRLLLLDEPTAGMNQREKQDMLELLTELRQDGLTMLLVEHDMRFVMEVSDRIVVVHHGRKIADDVPAVVRADAGVVDAYLGKGFTHA